MNEKQKAAFAALESHLAHSGDKFWVKMDDPITEGVNPTRFVAGHVGKDEAARWYDYHYSFIIGPRGAITMVDGPKHMKEDWNGKRWCGILIKIR